MTSEEINSEINVSILTASLNESGNIKVWLVDILSVYQKFNLKMIKEIVIVDDGSTDGTIEQIEDMIKIYPIPIHLLKRNNKMGTLNAQIIGSKHCSCEYIIVMDCDMQHPPSFIPNFIAEIKGDLDIIVGSRYIKGGQNNWPAYRGVVSRSATFLAHMLIGNTRKLTDPLSGFFIIRRELFSKLRPYKGMYKPLLYAVSMRQNTRMLEIPIKMDSRESGQSKIVTNPVKVIIRYIRELLIFFRDKHTGN
ncbi:MAG: glycosyltransferase [Candidatus Thermoplasmatota archaeon]|nr:glycosyltransferase [Candidatus Thermoplasmatota archaeon]